MIFKKLFKQQENKVVNIPLKVVYHGPPGSGKTSNLLFLHEQIAATEKDPELTRICSDDDPDEFITLFEAVPKKISAIPGYQFSKLPREVVLSKLSVVANRLNLLT